MSSNAWFGLPVLVVAGAAVCVYWSRQRLYNRIIESSYVMGLGVKQRINSAERHRLARMIVRFVLLDFEQAQVLDLPGAREFVSALEGYFALRDISFEGIREMDDIERELLVNELAMYEPSETFMMLCMCHAGFLRVLQMHLSFAKLMQSVEDDVDVSDAATIPYQSLEESALPDQRTIGNLNSLRRGLLTPREQRAAIRITF